MIDKVGKACTGCSACVQICPKTCITLKENKEGFAYPVIDLAKCINCNRCEKACPILTEIRIERKPEEIHSYAVIHKNDDIRKVSSSGGAFSVLASWVLAQGGAVFGAAFDENFEVHHIYVETEAEMYRLRGSKYVQSRIGDTYRQAEKFLKQGRWVLFSGTACQTSGLIGYLGRDYDNLLTQDLICHGVPSPLAWRKYVKLREQLAKSKTEHIFFRDKTFGWHNWHVSFDFKNHTNYKASQFQDMMIVSFLRGECSRECCYDCHFKQKYRKADFTLADLWGIEHIDPEWNDEKGLSVCFVNSRKAVFVFEQIKAQVHWKEVDVEQAVKYNMAMIESETLKSGRAAFMNMLPDKSFDMVYGECIEEIGTATKIKWTVRRLLGSKVYDRLLGR